MVAPSNKLHHGCSHHIMCSPCFCRVAFPGTLVRKCLLNPNTPTYGIQLLRRPAQLNICPYYLISDATIIHTTASRVSMLRRLASCLAQNILIGHSLNIQSQRTSIHNLFTLIRYAYGKPCPSWNREHSQPISSDGACRLSVTSNFLFCRQQGSQPEPRDPTVEGFGCPPSLVRPEPLPPLGSYWLFLSLSSTEYRTCKRPGTAIGRRPAWTM